VSGAAGRRPELPVQDLLDFCGVPTDHIAIRTSLYTEIATAAAKVRVHGLNYINRTVDSEESLLIVDDVYDSGHNIRQVVDDIHNSGRKNTEDVRIATVYCEPARCIPSTVPHYYLHDTDKWPVFPHDRAGRSFDEILTLKPGIDAIRARVAAMQRKKV
jgi:hypoxanthine phosphoribosyltransferase